MPKDKINYRARGLEQLYQDKLFKEEQMMVV